MCHKPNSKPILPLCRSSKCVKVRGQGTEDECLWDEEPRSVRLWLELVDAAKFAKINYKSTSFFFSRPSFPSCIFHFSCVFGSRWWNVADGSEGGQSYLLLRVSLPLIYSLARAEGVCVLDDFKDWWIIAFCLCPGHYFILKSASTARHISASTSVPKGEGTRYSLWQLLHTITKHFVAHS